jgi:hypothetical protein
MILVVAPGRARRWAWAIVVPLGLTLWALEARSVVPAPAVGERITPAEIQIVPVPPEPPEDERSRAAAPETEPEVEAEAEPDPRLEPATRAARKVLDLQASIRASLTFTAYRHRTVIHRDEGVYVWDCSAMVAWFLRRVAPEARKAMGKGRPVARDFWRQIARAPTKRPKNGWQRLRHIEDVRPGDMFAWVRPPGFPSRNTGHTGFALEPARPVPELPGAYTLRILDATSLPHDQDTRDPEGEGGIGEGTILFFVSEEGRGTAYGWFGRRSRGVIATDIVFGRVSR